MVELNFFGEGARLEHVGLVVHSIEAVSAASEVTFDPTQKVRVAFVTIGGAPFELIEPCGDDSPVAASLRKGVKLVHACYTVPDIEAAIESARQHGFFCLARPVPAAAFEGRRISWLYSKTFGLFELLEAKADV